MGEISVAATGSGKGGEVKAELLRRCGNEVELWIVALSETRNRKAQDLHNVILFFAALSRFITDVGRARRQQHSGLKMDSQSRAFEAPVEEMPPGVPLRCHRSMPVQPLVPWTPGRIIGVLFQALVTIPIQLAPARLSRRRA